MELLLARGKEKRQLTAQEVADVLMLAEEISAQIENVLQTLAAEGIVIVEEKQSPQSIPPDDPVHLYLQEISRVAPLTPQQEISLAERVDRSEQSVDEVLEMEACWTCVWNLLEREISAGETPDDGRFEALRSRQIASEAKSRLEAAKFGPEALQNTKELLVERRYIQRFWDRGWQEYMKTTGGPALDHLKRLAWNVADGAEALSDKNWKTSWRV